MAKALTIMTLDTETASLTGGVYDLGFVIHNKKGEIVNQFNAVVREIATDPKLMMGAYYAKKMFSDYIPALADQKVLLLPWQEIVKTMQEAIERYNVQVIAAYNLPFDKRVIRATHRQLGGKGAIVPRKVQQLDIWEYACRSRLVLKKYKELAKAQGWISEAGNIKTTAECAYRFVSGNLGFIEAHTALHDAQIEAQILAACYATKSVVPYGVLTGQPWRLVNAA